MVARTERTDVVLVGGGIMSATLGVFLKELEPTWNIILLERLDKVAQESSNPWNNAGRYRPLGTVRAQLRPRWSRRHRLGS